MITLTPEQILVISVLSVWFLFPLGILISFIKQSNEAKSPKITCIMTAGDIAHSEAYAHELDDENEDKFAPTSIPTYQIPVNPKVSNNYTTKF